MIIPPQLLTMLTAMLPIGELRSAIPVALFVYKLPLWEAYFWSVLGNIIPIIFLLWLLESVSDYLSKRMDFFKRFFTWLFERTRRQHTVKFEVWGSLSLILFVAIPLPITGAWTGAVAAFVFGVPFKKALGLIFTGILISGIIVSFLSLGLRVLIV